MGLDLIRSIYRKKTEERERRRKEQLEKVFKTLEKLSQEVSFTDVYIFGSVTEEYGFHEHSDIDVAFKDLDRDKLYYVVSFLSRNLGRDVNAVHLEDIHFRNKIMKEGIIWKKS